MQRQGKKSPRNKPGLRLNLVLRKLIFKWYAGNWLKLGLATQSLDKLGLYKTGFSYVVLIVVKNNNKNKQTLSHV